MTNIRESVCSHPLHGLMKRFTGTFPTNKVLVETTHELLCCFVVYGPQCHQHWTCTRSQERMSNSNNSLGTDVSTCTVATAKDNQFCLKSNLWDVGHCQYVVFLSRYLFFSRFLFSWFPLKRVLRSKNDFSTLFVIMSSEMNNTCSINSLKNRLFCCFFF